MTGKRYVVGFVFEPGGHMVMLLRKNRPTWQAGYLNGIGGKVEEGEEPLAAMIREAEEEAGVPVCGWEHVATLSGHGFTVWFYSTFLPGAVLLTARTDEGLVPLVVADLWREKVVPNLRVLIPLALDRSGLVKPVELRDSVRAGTPIPRETV